MYFWITFKCIRFGTPLISGNTATACIVYEVSSSAASTDFSSSRVHDSSRMHANEIKHIHKWEFGRQMYDLPCMRNDLIAKQSKNTKFLLSHSDCFFFWRPSNELLLHENADKWIKYLRFPVWVCLVEIYGSEWEFMVAKLRIAFIQMKTRSSCVWVRDKGWALSKHFEQD